MTSGLPLDDDELAELEARAAEQRRRLHDTVTDLRQTVRNRLDIKQNVRDNLGPVAGTVALLGLALGYLAAGLFTRD